MTTITPMKPQAFLQKATYGLVVVKGRKEGGNESIADDRAGQECIPIRHLTLVMELVKYNFYASPMGNS